MRKEKGITLISLIIYIFVMNIVLVIMGTIITSFYNNNKTVQGNVQDIVEFNKFNGYFLEEIKSRNNKIEKIEKNDYILFSSGNSFSISNNSIYYNNLKICDNVESIEIALGKDGDGVDKTIISVTLTFESFYKTMNYKLENIY